MFVGAVVAFAVLHAAEHTSETGLSQMVEHFLQLHCQVMQLKSVNPILLLLLLPSGLPSFLALPFSE